ncbi:probable transcriptional regulatory protein CPn_0573/CP_0176/CPj0573/CpB0595 [Saccostrea echinata]|uniref:probable transcriptional regulatory protein CPn_0573/CP_0176/CPj0573/CpB0595 n=1 Tax=Saccostrea echinata TaxID=191078 RepID=UPI002A7F8797|nr:probable transcriptional regulatory protein CPn_0573/CP_0176/CPj0573/CpB0595 [Saccostrea echinata]
MEAIHQSFLRVLQRTTSCSWTRHNLYRIQRCSLHQDLVRHRISKSTEISVWTYKAVQRKALLQTVSAVHLQTNRHMAGHSKYSNIKHRKEAQDYKKSTMMNQYVRLAITAVKEGGSTDPKLNPRLAQVLENIKKQSLSVDAFNRMLEKMNKKGMNSKEHMYEVNGPGNSIFIVLMDTDNVNNGRTDLKNALKRLPVKISNSPTTLHYFKQQGILYVTPDPNRPDLDLEEVAIECEAEDVTTETNEEGQKVIKFICDPSQLMEVKSRLEGQNLTVESFFEDYSPLMPVTPSEAELEEINTIIDRLEGADNFVQMYSNIKS